MSVRRSIASRGPAAALPPLRSELSEGAGLAPSLVARLDHDLRNSLNLFVGALELLATTSLTPEQQKLVDMCRQSAASANETITRFLSAPGGEHAPVQLPATHSADSASGAQTLDPAVIRYVAKPVTSAKLLASIRACVRSEGPSPVLLADDSEDTRWLVESVLRGSHQIDAAENGRIALEKFKAGSYCLVLADIEMPVMDGREFVSAMRQWERESKRPPTPVVMLTGHSLEEPILVQPDEDLRHLIPAFLAARQRDVDTLSHALAGGDYATIQKLGHHLKGTGGSYGFDGITEIGSALEEAAAAHRLAEVEHHIEVLRDYLRRVWVA